MKVMLCGGEKTNVLRQQIMPKFNYGQVLISIIETINNLEEYLNKGNDLDRVVIFERGITKDGEIREESEIRESLSMFTSTVSKMLSSEFTSIFVVNSIKMAQLISEETMELGTQCRILVHEGSFNVSFICRLVAYNIEDIEPDEVYIPNSSTLIEEEEENIQYSTYEENPNSGDDLKSIKEIEFTGLDSVEQRVEPEESNLEPNTGIEVKDFDGWFSEIDSSHVIESFNEMVDDFKTDKSEKQEKPKGNAFSRLKIGLGRKQTGQIKSKPSKEATEEAPKEAIQKSEPEEQEEILNSSSSSSYTMPCDSTTAQLEQIGDTSEGVYIPNDTAWTWSEQDPYTNGQDPEEQDQDEQDHNNATSLWDDDKYDQLETSEPDDLDSLFDDDPEEQEEPYIANNYGMQSPNEYEKDEIEEQDSPDSDKLVIDDLDSLFEDDPEEQEEPEKQCSQDSSKLEIDELSSLFDDDPDELEEPEEVVDIFSMGKSDGNGKMGGLRITDDDLSNDEELYDQDQYSFKNDPEQIETKEADLSSLFEDDPDDIDALYGLESESQSIRNGLRIDQSGVEDILNIDERSPRESKSDLEDEIYIDPLTNKSQELENESNTFIGEEESNPKEPSAYDETQANKQKNRLFSGVYSQKKQKNNKKQREYTEQPQQTKPNKDLPMQMHTEAMRHAEEELGKMLSYYRGRGTSIVVTGTNCSGKSVTAYNLANIVSKLGFTVLVVDMDTVNRAQAYISSDAYDAVHSLDPENPSLKQALNTTDMGINKYASIIKPGFHVLTMGLAGDVVKGERLAPRKKLTRFGSNVRNNYNVVIYDMPFEVATEYAEDITYTADNILITCEASNHGLMSLMLSMCNIEKDEMQETMFKHSQLCFTKYIDLRKVFGQDIKNAKQALLRIDREVQELLGVDPEFYFSAIPICGIMKFNSDYEETWFSRKAYSDSIRGRGEYVDLLHKILNRH